VPGPGVRKHYEIYEAHDLLLEQKALNHGGDQRRGQVEEVELRRLSYASVTHGELSARVEVGEQSLVFL